jgi:hypothetical protein
MNNKHKYSTIVLIVLVAIIGGGIAISSLSYSSVQCTGTDKLSNVSFNGTNINGVCTEDSGGITNNITNNITYYINTTNNITNNITVASNTITKYLIDEFNITTTTPTLLPNFTTTLEANKLYEIRCRILADTNITANSPRFYFNYTGTVITVRHSCETSTSGTARFQAGSKANNFGCLSTANIGVNTPTPFYYEGLVKDDATPSNFTIYFVGETTATQYRVYDGSMCEIERLN